MLLGAYVDTEDLLALRTSQQRSVRSRRASQHIGERLSRVRGRGMDFAEVRAYQPGDDVRTIDWRVTARRNKPHTKVFTEEKERPTLVVVDQTRSLFFGSRARLKSVAAAEIGARLAWRSLANNDRVGGIVVGSERLAVHRPLRNQRAVARFINEIATSNRNLHAQTKGTTTFRDALPSIAHLARSGHRIYLITDYHALEVSDREALLHLSRHNDVQAIFIFDPLEAQLPPANRYRVTDQAQTLQFHSGNPKLRAQYQRRFRERGEELDKLCRDTHIRSQTIATDEPF